jgi:hypothetical protein
MLTINLTLLSQTQNEIVYKMKRICPQSNYT